MRSSGDESPASLRDRVDRLRDQYTDCDLCAHHCHVDRTAGEIGTCQVDETVRIGSYGPHVGEEDPLSGRSGSGTIFLAHCNLACVFCQNYQLSQEPTGTTEAGVEDIADIALSLQENGCHNINFVTPTHHAPTLASAVLDARDRGLEVPIVWNCGGYENEDIIELLDGIVDIYMPDVKWSNEDAARKYSKAPGYWSAAKSALKEMHSQIGDLTLDQRGIAERGMLIRHLIMPGQVENSKRIVDFVATELSTETYLNLMAQYRPAYKVGRKDRYEEINRRPTREEYDTVVRYAKNAGLTRLDVNSFLR